MENEILILIIHRKNFTENLAFATKSCVHRCRIASVSVFSTIVPLLYVSFHRTLIQPAN